MLTAGPLLAAAAGIATVAIIGTVLLSRQVLRPIDTLTAAAQRLGRGDLTGRVPVRGNDELAELARSFNRMADSLQRGEERQRRLVADVDARAESAGVSLRVAAEPVAIHADPDRLRQVVGNLVTNALRATAAGGSVRLVASRTDTQAIVQVVDTGSGIAADALPQVFDRFWRAAVPAAVASPSPGRSSPITRAPSRSRVRSASVRHSPSRVPAPFSAVPAENSRRSAIGSDVVSAVEVAKVEQVQPYRGRADQSGGRCAGGGLAGDRPPPAWEPTGR